MAVETPSAKHAEQQYLARAGTSRWEREKPFSPPATDTLEESLELLHDFSVAVRLLDPAPSDRILDLGAGGGWCSDLLRRLNRRTVAVDISLDMLQVSQQRGATLAAVTGDMEHLPFATGSFHKAICLNALHHVPDMAAALQEIARVLTAEGVAVFSEPGSGHARTPTSVAATQDFGVLEQEVLIEPFIHQCRTAGFHDVFLCPISYAIPQFTLSLDEWRAWQRLSRRKRPLRAMGKIARAVMELVGFGKNSATFEETFAIRLVRLFQKPVETHPFIIASKSPRRANGGSRYLAALHVVRIPTVVRGSAPVEATLHVRNEGTVAWAVSDGSAVGAVRIGVQLLDSGGKLIARDFARCALETDVPPGGSSSVSLTFGAPPPGQYVLKFDLVSEGVIWFEQAGSTPVLSPLLVE